MKRLLLIVICTVVAAAASEETLHGYYSGDLCYRDYSTGACSRTAVFDIRLGTEYYLLTEGLPRTYTIGFSAFGVEGNGMLYGDLGITNKCTGFNGTVLFVDRVCSREVRTTAQCPPAQVQCNEHSVGGWCCPTGRLRTTIKYENVPFGGHRPQWRSSSAGTSSEFLRMGTVTRVQASNVTQDSCLVPMSSCAMILL